MEILAVVRLEAVGLQYGHGPEVLKDITFSLRPGEFRFITGPSGAGKTSLLRMLFLALKPTRGLMTVLGQDAVSIARTALPELRRRIGVVFQEFRLLDHLTTYDNIALPLRVAGQREASYRSDVLELMSWVGLSEQAKVYPPVLSGGEKQRAAIARAVIGRPDLLLADEPTGNVDPGLARRLLRLFLELNRMGTTVLIATHDTNLIAQVKAPVMRIDRGQLRMVA
jgi:cell division transport system ATP-binding protein